MQTSFWTEKWLNDESPQTLAPNLFKLAIRKNITVRDALHAQNWMRGLQNITTNYGPGYAKEMRQFTKLWSRLREVNLLEGQEDNIAWTNTASKCCEAKSAYRLQFLGTVTKINYKKLWKSKAEGKCKFFFWVILQGKILINDNLGKKGIGHAGICHLCDQTEETTMHLIIQCPTARSIWQLVNDCKRMMSSPMLP